MAIESIDVIVKSIEKINPNAKYAIRDRDINNIEWLENTTPIPVVDIEAKMVETQAELEAKANAEETDKSSGKQKLKDLGLTDAEIKALTGA